MKANHLEQLLAGFGKTCGLNDLVLDERGLCRLVFDDQFAIDIMAMRSPRGDEACLLSSSIGRVAEDADPKLLHHFLAANLYVRDPNDAFVCLYPEREEALLLCRHDTTRMDDLQFEEVLMDFLRQVQTWTGFIARGDIEQGGHAAAHDALMADGFVRA